MITHKTMFDEAKAIPTAEVFSAFFPDRQLKQDGERQAAVCIFHSENTPSLKIYSKNFHCFGCGASGSNIDLVIKANLAASPLEAAKLLAGRFQIKTEGTPPPETTESVERLSLAELAEFKKLDEKFLKSIGLRNTSRGVLIPYMTVSGEVNARRYRLNAKPPFRWAKGSHVSLYGLERLEAIQKAGWCLLVEGESDSWTMWSYDLPALGVPGKTVWKPEFANHLKDIKVFLWQEPGAEDFARRVAKDLPNLSVIAAPDGCKDISEAHLQGRHVPTLIEELKGRAFSGFTLLMSAEEAERTRLKNLAAKYLNSDDPFELIKAEVTAAGYGGSLDVPLIVYLAVTSRLLKMRHGILPVHLQLLAVPSAGKSYAMTTVIKLLPENTWHRIDAGSPRVLIYDDADLKHKVLIFDEIDSLPEGEDNPAASALRNLLQEHQLKYSVVVYDTAERKFVTQAVVKPGPTVLLTTGTRRTGPQLDSRLFCIEVPEDREQIKKALETQAEIELQGTTEPTEAALAYQGYLQSLAPWEVVVPFVKELAAHISKGAHNSRILRDHPRILSLIKSVTILRHAHRQRDEQNRLIATVDDYAVVYGLIGKTYEAAASGASEGVRAAVEAVKDIHSSTVPVTVSQVAKRLKISKPAASRRVAVALENGWLVNKSAKMNGKSYDLDIGEPLPDEESALPKSDELADRSTVNVVSEGGIPSPISDPKLEVRPWPRKQAAE